jgi:autotransporter-associated beta strand protein
VKNLKKLFCAGLVIYLSATWRADAAYTDPTVTLKVISTSSATHQPVLVFQTNGPTTVTLVASTNNFAPTNFVWSQVAETNNTFAATGVASFSAAQTSSNQVTVTLPAWGVYQFQVVASDGVTNASRYVWVNVWPAVGAAQPNVQIGRNPDIAPPTSVRQFSPDPGPFFHPRVLFSRADWPELNRKMTNAFEVRLAITNLQTALNNNFDKAGSQMRTNITIYTNYASGGYSGTYFTNAVLPARTNNASVMASDLIIGHNPSGAYFDALVTACYLAWVGTDPTLPHGSVAATNQARFNYLATLVAATAKVEMNLNATLSGGNNNSSYATGTNMATAYDMALCYDFVYDWMTPQQQNDTRDYLYAIGYGYNNTGGGGISRSSVWDGHLQNGDFPNLADGIVLPQLAIEGEEANVTAAVTNAFGATLPYATGAGAWPYASPAAVNNLRRLLNWNTDWFVSPWGFIVNMVDYFQLGQNISAPAALALARRGEDQFTTTYYYQSSLAALYNIAPGEDGKGMRLFDHHDGLPFTPGPGQLNAAYIVKYVYPDDPMVDYVYRAFRVENENDLAQAMFASDPTNTTLATVAQQKNLALTKFDPERAVVVSRNGWGENDLNLVFENRFDQDGHMHAERNNFSLYALGRAWSSPPGYHCTINDLQATVLIQNTNLISDPATAGYIAQSPSSATITTNNSWGPPPPGKLVEITEDPAKQWTLFAGDASPAYNFGLGTNNSIDTGVTQAQNAWPGLLSNLSAYTQSQLASTWKVQSTNYNAVQYALRSVLTVRGTNPYVLVLDDICKDGTPQNYRWSMPCAVSFGPSGGRFVDANSNAIYSSLTNLSGATATDITLYHLIDQGTNNQKGLPRLLVRDVTEAATANQPPIFVENHPSGLGSTNLTYGWDNNSKVFTYVPSSRVLITRTNVVSPSFKILLYPFLSGSNTPTSSWNSNNTVLTISNNSTVDAFVFNRTNSDHRTRITGFTRTLGHAAPALTVPTNYVVTANTLALNGQFGAAANFSVTATDYLGSALSPVFSLPPGTVFPVGVTTVQVSAMDPLGEQTSTSFPVNVLPPPPLLWKGDGTTNAWNFSATNWILGAGQIAYAEPVSVIFDDSGSASPPIALAQTVQPTSVIFSNVANGYTIGGTGKISGAGNLVLATAGTVTLLTTNDYTGGTTISSGATLQAGNGTAAGAIGSGNVTNNGTLAFNLPNTQTVAGNISGGGSLSLAGTGTLVLSNNNAHSGLTTVSGGTLQIGTGATSGSVPTNISLTGGSIVFNRTDNYSQAGFISGTSINSSITDSGTAAGNSLALNFSVGTNIFSSLFNNSAGTLALSAASATNIFSSRLSIASGGSVIFNGGNYQFTNDGFANGGQSGYGTCVVSNGANVLLGVGSWINWTNLEVIGSNSVLAGNAGLTLLGNRMQVTIANGGSLATTSGSVGQGNLFGPAYNGYQSSVTVQQTGGAMSLAANKGYSLGGAAGGYTNSYALSGGTVNLLGGSSANLTLGADTGGTGLTLFSLTGAGKLLASGTVSGSQTTGTPRQLFDFSGGMLTAGTINTTWLSSTNAPTTYGTLVNNGGMLAPGDAGTPGKTIITGNYAVSNNAAKLAIDLGGVTQASAFQDATNKFDFVSISGAATLGGNLNVRLLNNFVPATNNSFTILTASGGVSGAFTNVTGNRVPLVNYSGGSFLVVTTATSLILTNFQIAPTNPPTITGISLTATNLIITGTNGVAGASYLVLTTTNLVLPVASWNIIATQQFQSGGAVNFTNPLNPNSPQLFYRLRLP